MRTTSAAFASHIKIKRAVLQMCHN